MKVCEFSETTAVRLNPEQMIWLRTEAGNREVFVSELIRELIDAKRLGE